MLLGGLYDLEPLQASFLKNEIAITDADVAAFSPLRHRHDPDTDVTVLVGEDETEPFHAQADAFSAHLAEQGLRVSSHSLFGRNHMDSVRDLGVAGSQAADALMSLIAGSGTVDPWATLFPRYEGTLPPR